MRRVLLTLAILAAVGLAAETVVAWTGHCRRRGPSAYGGHGIQYEPYRPMAPRAYGYSAQHGVYTSQHRLSFEASVSRIMAKHSRYRYQTHPRSLYNAPPPGYYRRGW